MILNVNKPKDWTSFDVVAKIRGMSKIKKVGHAGTLDPLATGVLVVLTGPDTRKQERIMKSEKEYVGEVTFGVRSNTYDLEGEIEVNSEIPDIQEIKQKLPEIIKKYIGEFEQTVPAYSAVKVKGQKLYNLARKNKLDESLELPTKKVNVKDIEIIELLTRSLEIDGKTLEYPAVKLKITCSAGFYVRTLANDLGADIDNYGLLTDLVRTKVGNYNLENSVEIKDLKFESPEDF